MLESQDVDLDGHTFHVNMLPATKALEVLRRISRALGPSLAAVVAASNGATIGAIDISTVGPAFTTLFDRLDEAELKYLTKAFLETALVDGDPLWRQIDTVFMGKTFSLMKLMRFAFEVNFGDFFAAARGFVASHVVPKASPSAGSSTSTGASGAS